MGAWKPGRPQSAAAPSDNNPNHATEEAAMNTTKYTGVTLAGLALAGATLVGTAPAAMARLDPGPGAAGEQRRIVDADPDGRVRPETVAPSLPGSPDAAERWLERSGQTADPYRGPAQFRRADEDSMTRTDSEPAPVSEAGAAPWELGLAATAGAAAAGVLVLAGLGVRAKRVRRSH
jgi:hypothetical protein